MHISDFEHEARRVAEVYSARGYDHDPTYADTDVTYLQRVQSIERWLLEGLRAAGKLDGLPTQRVLDYGCGNGRWLGRMLAWGASPVRLAGTDVRPQAVLTARASFPSLTIETTLNGRAPFLDQSFDVIFVNLVMSSIMCDMVRQALVNDLDRLLAPDGVVVICDLRVNNPSNPSVRAVTRGGLAALMADYDVAFRRSLVLAPPLAKRVVPRSWALADALEALLPPLRTHAITVLSRRP